MNKNSNIYIIVYSAVMVVVVAVLLAFAALSLKAPQEANVRIEKMSAILASIGKGEEAAKAKDKTAYVTAEYEKYITESYCVDTRGDKVEGVDAFAQLDDLKAEYAKPAEARALPVFISNDGGVVRYIFPVWGVGLWGPVWGYVALEADLNTIYGASFDHKGETPGLGAEITTPDFTEQFKAKTLFEGGKFVSVTVLKGAGASEGDPHAVDAISGGTITSRGVEAMLRDCLTDYLPFIEKQRVAVEQEEPTSADPEADGQTINE